MKNSKTKNLFIAASFALTAIAAGSYAFSVGGEAFPGKGKGTEPVTSISGTIDFSFVPEGDYRTWHIVNNYHNTGDDPGYNVSEYVFSSDSVNVKTDYAGLPAQDDKSFFLSNTLLNENSFHN